MATVARKILRYVKGTRTLGIEYTREKYDKFYRDMKVIADHPDNVSVDKNLWSHPISSFADASFAPSSFIKARSITGIVLFLYGVPIAWKSSPQTLVSRSTMEAEWVAQSSSIALTQPVQATLNFLRGVPEAEVVKSPLCLDNRSALLGARHSLGQMTKVTRHGATRHAAVREESDRLLFTSTELQRAEATTKNPTRHMLDSLAMTFLAQVDHVESNIDYAHAYLTRTSRLGSQNFSNGGL